MVVGEGGGMRISMNGMTAPHAGGCGGGGGGRGDEDINEWDDSAAR